MLESQYQQLIKSEAVDNNRHCLVWDAISKIWRAAMSEDEAFNDNHTIATYEDELNFWRAFARENCGFADFYFRTLLPMTNKGLLGEDPTRIKSIILECLESSPKKIPVKS